MVVYGIKNCNTVKKALNWLDEHNIDYQFHDYKKLGIDADKISEWQGKIAWELLINKRGTTWRKLNIELQESIVSPDAAKELMQKHTSLIKRPIIESENTLLIGFDEIEYQDKLSV
jgi:arsenate reductase